MSGAETLSRIELDWPDDPRYRAVGRLVLGGVAARVELPLDRVDELGLALDTLARVAATDGRLRLTIDVGEDALSIALGTFAADPLADPAVRRIVVPLVTDAESSTVPGGTDVLLTAVVDRPMGE